MKLRTLLSQCAAAGAIAAGCLTLAPGTAQAAVNCNYLRNQITAYRNQVDWDWTMVVYWGDMGDDAQYDMWIEIAAEDQATETQLHTQYYAAHCA